MQPCGRRKVLPVAECVISLGLNFYLVKLCDLIRPAVCHLKVTSLALLGMLPVYYKTFSFVRGEPLLAFLSVLAAYITLMVFVKKRGGRANTIALGVCLGLLILTRQWGLFLLPACIVFVAILMLKRKQERSCLLKDVVLSLALAVVAGGWFYGYPYKEFGTATVFNRPPRPTFSFSNQPTEYYFGLGLDKLFTDPVRRSFPNRCPPIFYSET